MVRWVK